ncbi:MAG: hypothetical protein JST00_11870 [Deltaproteobacteria bacterium]|nr:hypothetical protein [Deltaproteobacteria bacterium]
MRAFRAWALWAASTAAMAIVLTGGSGCSSSSDSSPGAAGQGAAGEMGWTFASESSGSRLRAKVLTGGGAREVVGFFDTARQEDCTFQETADGKWRCLPAPVPLSGGLFADAQCTRTLLSVSTCAADPRYAMSFGGVGCSSRVVTNVYRVTGPAATAYSSTGTGCVPSSPASSQQKAFGLGDQVSLEEFVSATESPVENGVVTETTLLAADGARQHFGYRVNGFNASCTFQVMADGVARCLPRTQQSQILYLDAECTTPAFTYGGGSPSCGDSEVLVREPAMASGCSAIKNVFRLGEPAATSSSSSTSSGSTFDPPADGPKLYSGNPGGTTTCYPTSYYNWGSTRSLLNVTASLPATGRIGRGTSRLVPALVTRAGSEELVHGWFDTERNVDCSFTKASDGKMRCLPTGPNGVAFFTDTACKSPTRVATRGGPLSCAQAAAKHVRVTETPTPSAAGTCPGTTSTTPTTRVYELGGDLKNLGPSSYETSPGRCAQVQGVNGAFDAKELDPALFVEGIPGTE